VTRFLKGNTASAVMVARPFDAGRLRVTRPTSSVTEQPTSIESFDRREMKRRSGWKVTIRYAD